MPTDPVPVSTPWRAGGCLQPVLLRGRVDHIDGATGELLHRYTTVYEPGGVLLIACKTRRASRCPPCADVYQADTYQLIRAGLSGGKGVPETVATHPCLFATLTAPSFGPVHVQREKDGRPLRCRPRRRGQTCPHGYRLSCPERHDRDDARLGEPLCPDCYDYTGAVLFNACAPELWRRFTITLRRMLARRAGLSNKQLAAQLRVSYAKVAEYQRRGVVHFHAIIRLDGPAGPSTTPPSWATLDLLNAAIVQAANAVHLETPGGTFTVRIQSRPGLYIRIEIEDGGGPWLAPAPDPGSGRGLDIIRVLAAEWGIATSPAGRTVWARFNWPSPIGRADRRFGRDRRPAPPRPVTSWRTVVYGEAGCSLAPGQLPVGWVP